MMNDETSGAEQPVRWTDINGVTHTSPAGTMRTFSLNSPEGHAALCTPRERPWIANGALPPEPRAWNREVIVEERLR